MYLPIMLGLHSHKQVKNKKFYENFIATYFYFKKKCDICTYKSDGGISYAPETLKNGLPCPRSGHLFSTLFVITGNLNIYKKIRIQ